MTGNSPVELFNDAVLASPYQAYDQMRSAGAVHYEPALDLFFVVDHKAILEVLENPAVYSSHLVAVLQRDMSGVSLPSSEVPGGVDVLAVADPPVHTGHRKLVKPTFGKREMQDLREQIDEEVTRRVEVLISAGGGDWIAAVASPVPVWVISGILGLPSGDAEKLVHWSDAAVELLSGVATTERLAVIFADVAEFMAYLGDRLAAESAGLLNSIRAAVEEDQLTKDEAVALLMQVVVAGTESTTSLLGSAVRILAATPDLQTRLRADFGHVSDFIEETLRLESPFRGHFRVATSDTTLGGTPIPAGGRLMLMWGAANRDPNQYGHPELLDLTRPAVRGHLAFGRGIHFCIGAHLARLEAQIAIERLLELSDHFELSADHEDFYRPSLLVRRLEHVRVSIAPRI